MSVAEFANTKTIKGIAGWKFEKPVTVTRFLIAVAFFLVQWSVYAVVLGASGIINTILSIGCAGLVTYKLLRYLKVAKRVEEDTTAE
jgi:hypothetical protein